LAIKQNKTYSDTKLVAIIEFIFALTKKLEPGQATSKSKPLMESCFDTPNLCQIMYGLF